MDDDNYFNIKWTNKYHYSKLIEILQYTDKLELGLFSAIDASEELFKATLTEMLENIVKTCENTGFTGTSIYENGIKMIESGKNKA